MYCTPIYFFFLSKHHEEMDEIDTKRKKDFQRHEMDKEHKRKQGEKNLDESKRNEAEEERKRLRQKHVDDAKKINHPVSFVEYINIIIIHTVHIMIKDLIGQNVDKIFPQAINCPILRP